MKKLAAALALLAFGPSHAATLETRNYTIEITPLCGEAVRDCEQFAYAGTHNRSGVRTNITGKPGMRACIGSKPCDPLGWQFYDGNTSYFISQDGQVIVTNGRKTLVNERGAWRN